MKAEVGKAVAKRFYCLTPLPRRQELRDPLVILGDFDSIHKHAFEERTDLKFIHAPDQDKTDLQKILEHTLALDDVADCERIVLMGGLNGRFDHTMATVSCLVKFAHSKKSIFALDGDNLVMVLEKGEHSISWDLSKLTNIIGIVPTVQKETIATSKGLKWELDNTNLEFGKLISTSNELVSETLNLITNQPILVTVQLKL